MPRVPFSAHDDCLDLTTAVPELEPLPGLSGVVSGADVVRNHPWKAWWSDCGRDLATHSSVIPAAGDGTTVYMTPGVVVRAGGEEILPGDYAAEFTLTASGFIEIDLGAAGTSAYMVIECCPDTGVAPVRLEVGDGFPESTGFKTIVPLFHKELVSDSKLIQDADSTIYETVEANHPWKPWPVGLADGGGVLVTVSDGYVVFPDGSRLAPTGLVFRSDTTPDGLVASGYYYVEVDTHNKTAAWKHDPVEMPAFMETPTSTVRNYPIFEFPCDELCSHIQHAFDHIIIESAIYAGEIIVTKADPDDAAAVDKVSVRPTAFYEFGADGTRKFYATNSATEIVYTSAAAIPPSHEFNLGTGVAIYAILDKTVTTPKASIAIAEPPADSGKLVVRIGKVSSTGAIEQYVHDHIPIIGSGLPTPNPDEQDWLLVWDASAAEGEKVRWFNAGGPSGTGGLVYFKKDGTLDVLPPDGADHQVLQVYNGGWDIDDARIR